MLKWLERFFDWLDEKDKERGRRKCSRTGKHGKIVDDADFLPDGSAVMYGRCERCGRTSQPVPATVTWAGRRCMTLSPKLD